MKNIGILGSGVVATTLATGLINKGYKIKLGTRHPEKLDEWKNKAGANGSVGSFADAAAFGEILILAVKGGVAVDLIKSIDAAVLKGKAVLDATNPIANEPPQNGVLKLFTVQNESLMQSLQKAAPGAHFVKAFNSIGSPLMVDPDFGGQKPTMFICGDDDNAKLEATKICDVLGFETEDMGGSEAAGAIEALCILWCIPGFKSNAWNDHAFKLLKK